MKLKEHGLITRLVRTRPLFCAAVLFLCGCIVGYRLEPSYPMLFCALFLLATVLFVLRRQRRIAAVILLLMLLPLGALRFETAWNAVVPPPEIVNAKLAGRIVETPVYKEDTKRTICVLNDVSVDGKPMKGKLRLYLRGDEALLKQPQLAQYVSCDAHIWQADEATNPYEFDFSEYLRVSGICGYATAEIENSVLSASAYRIGDIPERLREAISARIERFFPENAALVKAFLIGDRSDMRQEDSESFLRAGVAHLLAVSGLHISMLAGLLSWLLGRFLKRKLSFPITLAVLFFYMVVTNFPPSLVRAALMFAIYGCAPLVGRHSDGPTRLAAAMMIQLMLTPTELLSAGFVLSYGASAGITFLSHPLRALFHADRLLTKKLRRGLRSFFTDKLPADIIRAVITTLAAQIAIYPAVIRYFGSQSPWSILSNLPTIPLAMLAFILSAVGLLSRFEPIVFAANKLLDLLRALVRALGELPFSELHAAAFPDLLILLCVIVFLLSSNLSKLCISVRRWLPLFIIPAILLSDLLAASTTRGCSIVFFNADQADCAMIRSEGKVYLVDVGDAYSPAPDYISAMAHSVEAVFLSHPHVDHCGGLVNLLKVTLPERIYVSANWDQLERDEGVDEALEQARQSGSEVVYLSAGDEIRLSDGTIMKVLAPSAGISDSSANNDSLLLKLEHGECSALFTGDRTAEAMPQPLPDIDILKIPHHGAKDAVSGAVLYETTPSVCIIPVGYNNYGHPAQETLTLLGGAGCHVFRTDLSGAVTCSLSRDGSVEVRSFNAAEAVHELG